MKQSGLRRIGVVVGICAFAGALAGIAGSAAAPSKSKATQAQKQAKANAKAQRRGFRRGAAGPGLFFGGPGGPGGPGGGPVHSESVVPNADGTGFDTITTDGGVLTSVDGNTLHIKEGTDKATYKDDVAIDVGSSPTVIRNRAKAALSDLKANDHVRVIKGSPQGTFVIAEDDAFLAQRKKDRPGFGHGHFGPPPPGAPAPPGDNQNGSSSSGSPAGGTNS